MSHRNINFLLRTRQTIFNLCPYNKEVFFSHILRSFLASFSSSFRLRASVLFQYNLHDDFLFVYFMDMSSTCRLLTPCPLWHRKNNFREWEIENEVLTKSWICVYIGFETSSMRGCVGVLWCEDTFSCRLTASMKSKENELPGIWKIVTFSFSHPFIYIDLSISENLSLEGWRCTLGYFFHCLGYIAWRKRRKMRE